jgi:hypothetical protein
MDIYYAVGGGMGHLTRATAFFYTFNLDYKNFIIIVSSPHAGSVLKHKNYITAPAEVMCNGALLQQWLVQIADKYNIKNIYLDTFPVGLYGEWNNFPSSGKYRFSLISRLLNWDKYFSLIITPPKFDVIYKFEELDTEQQTFYKNLSNEIRSETLYYPPEPVPAEFSEFLNFAKNPVWLIVHSETAEEVLTLFNYAMDVSQAEMITPTFAIVSQSVPESLHIVTFKFVPAYPCFEKVHKIFTASGFNSMQQTNNYRDKHIFIPFERKFDNQFLRAAFRKQSG